MERLATQIKNTTVAPGSLAIFWLGQAGFVYKTPAGSVVYLDAYLTDFAARTLSAYGYGFKRITQCPIDLSEVDADLFVSTHAHEDHLDQDAIPALVKNERIRFVGAPDCRDKYEQLGVPASRYAIIDKGQTLTYGDVTLTGVYADHGEATPHAIGILLTVGNIRVWQVGDTAYRPAHWQDLFAADVDVIIPPINGAFGNLTEAEAAQLAGDAHARIAIPCHFWTFAEHGGNPALFLEAIKQAAPNTQPRLMSHGERLLYTKS
jgi:L-ascorbate 6-phosphate lactonase